MRIAVLADLGQEVYHVGDEAIGHAACAELERRGATVVLLTRDVEDTRSHFGPVAAVPTLAFPWPPAQRADYLRRVTAMAAGQEVPDAPVSDLLGTLSSCDGLLIAGGGNLTSTYGWLLDERVAVARLADSLGMPVVISGQTLGPVLDEVDAANVASMVQVCRWAGFRDEVSCSRARSLATEAAGRIVDTLDDATFWWPEAKVPRPAAGSDGPHVVVTLAPGTGSLDSQEVAAAVGSALGRFLAAREGRVTFVPHMGTPGATDGDVAFHEAVAAALGRPATLRPIADAAEAAALVAGADLVVTSRFHPAVFALSHAVPVLALTATEYDVVRLEGLLNRWGMPGWTLALAGCRTSALSEGLEAVWQDRAAIATHLENRRPELRAAHHDWWDAVVEALRDGPLWPGTDAAPVFLPPASQILPAPEVFVRAQYDHAPLLALTGELARARVEADRQQSLAARAADELAHLTASRAYQVLARYRRGVDLAKTASSRLRRPAPKELPR